MVIAAAEAHRRSSTSPRAPDRHYEYVIRRVGSHDWTVAWTTSAFRSALGYSISELNHLGWPGIIRRTDLPVLLAAHRYAVAGRRFFLELPIRAKFGGMMWTHVEAVPELDESTGTVIEVVGLGEILEQRNAPVRSWCSTDDLRGAQSSHHTRTRRKPADIDSLGDQLRRLLSHVLPFDRMSIARYDRESNTVEVGFEWPNDSSRDWRSKPIRLAGTVEGDVINSGQPVCVNQGNLGRIIAWYPEYAGMVTSGTPAALAAPIVFGGKVIGLIVLRSSNLDAYTNADLLRLMPVARELGSVLASASSVAAVPGTNGIRPASGIGHAGSELAHGSALIGAAAGPEVMFARSSPGERSARGQAAVAVTGPSRAQSNDRYSVGALIVDYSRRVASVSGAQLKLSRLEFKLLFELVRNRGRVAERADLLRKVWGGQYGAESRYLTVYIGRLRLKLAEHAHARCRIETVRGVGYCITESQRPDESEVMNSKRLTLW